jgi:prolyl 4-hydroxylase
MAVARYSILSPGLRGPMNEPSTMYRTALASFREGDLEACRAAMAQASAEGDVQAGRAYAGLLATGTGGPRAWAESLAVLRSWSARDPVAAAQLALIERMRLTEEGDSEAAFEHRRLHPDKPISLVRALLTAEECGLLAALAAPHYISAQIYHRALLSFVQDPSRTNEAAGFGILNEWPFVHAINRRIAAASNTDVRHGEVLQVLRYAPGQEFKPHNDAGPGLVGNQRVATALIYLNADYEGGTTEFTRLGLSVRGATGDMLLFGNVDEADRPDPGMQHAGRPVTSGTKLIASRWIRRHPIPLTPPEPGGGPWSY